MRVSKVLATVVMASTASALFAPEANRADGPPGEIAKAFKTLKETNERTERLKNLNCAHAEAKLQGYKACYDVEFASRKAKRLADACRGEEARALHSPMGPKFDSRAIPADPECAKKLGNSDVVEKSHSEGWQLGCDQGIGQADRDADALKLESRCRRLPTFLEDAWGALNRWIHRNEGASGRSEQGQNPVAPFKGDAAPAIAPAPGDAGVPEAGPAKQ
jgi:hypothetical protein